MQCAYGKHAFPGKMAVLAVGGGGGGGQLGGGGGGGFYSSNFGVVTGGMTFNVTIGAGGASFAYTGCSPAPQLSRGTAGTPTTIAGPDPSMSITAYGGGGGGGGNNPGRGGTFSPTPTGGIYYCPGTVLEGGGYGLPSAYIAAGPGGGAGVLISCQKSPTPTTVLGGYTCLTPMKGGNVILGTGLTGTMYLGAGGGGAFVGGGNSTLAPQSCNGPNRLTVGAGGTGAQWYDGSYYGGGGGGSSSGIYDLTQPPSGNQYLPSCSRYVGAGGAGGGGRGTYTYKCLTNPTAGGHKICQGSGGTPGTGGGAGGGVQTPGTNTITGGPGVAIFIYSNPKQLATGGNSIVNVTTLVSGTCGTLPAPYVPSVIGSGPYWIHKFTSPGTLIT